MILDLVVSCYNPKLKDPFRVVIQEFALRQLIADSKEAYRVYELMAIRRPGDVLHYLWVQLVEVPQTVTAGCEGLREKATRTGVCDWPVDTVPLSAFDTLFYWCLYDTEPEAVCWLEERSTKRFRQFVEGLFDEVRAAQTVLRSLSDLLVKAELAALDEQRHYRDYGLSSPFQITLSTYQTPTTPQRATEYYEKLGELLRRPNVGCVAIRGDEDYQTLRVACTEQRFRACKSGLAVGEEMPISMLTDGVLSCLDWGAKVVFYQEGLGWGDLWIEQHRRGNSIRELVNGRGLRRPMYLSHRDEGELIDYKLTTGDGWFLYEDERIEHSVNMSRTRARQEWLERFGPL